MCAHQDTPFLDLAIISMLEQDFFEDFEIIIVANNCTDELWKKLHNYGASDPRIKLFRTKIGQLAFNLNYGLDKACGEYIVRMDSDDVCFSSRLADTLHALKFHDFPDVLCGVADLIDDEGRVIGGLGKVRGPIAISRALPFKNPIIHPATAIKVSAILSVRGYLGGINCEDYDLWQRMDRAGMKLLVSEFKAIKYRISDYQVKGGRIAYADAIGLCLREAVLRGSFRYFAGFLVSISKYYIFLMLGKMK